GFARRGTRERFNLPGSASGKHCVQVNGETGRRHRDRPNPARPGQTSQRPFARLHGQRHRGRDCDHGRPSPGPEGDVSIGNAQFCGASKLLNPEMFRLSRTTVLILIVAFFAVASAQEKPKPQASPKPSPSPEDSVKVFTEEVRLPVVAFDSYGHYDPTLELDDVLVLEDGVAQQLRSVRHIPANVLFILDTGGEASGLGGASKSTSLTRQVASRLVTQLQDGVSIAVMQSGNTSEMLQPWTTDKNAVLRTLKNKLISTKRSRISEAIANAGAQLRERPEGSRHVVMITDGVDTPGAKVDRDDA